MTSRADVITRGVARLAGAGVPDPERDARRLFRWAGRMDAAALTASLGDAASAREIGRFEQAIEAREGRAPVSHITGEREFWGRRFAVTPDVLDPRPETETLIAAALEGPRPPRILDLGTGSGCILLTLLAEWPEAEGLGIDISDGALCVARRNAERLGVDARARFARADWLDGVEGRFDLVVSNPPYLAEHERAGLAPEVRDHEPWLALGAGRDGLDAYRRIAARVARVLAPAGRLLLELGPGQDRAVAALLAEAGLETARCRPDMDGRTRVLAATEAAKSAAPAIRC
ncbi:MAG TPA: peptide chain release factor N(5)-glutamine methyltransferase [Thermohalobaculum sp.]|nr:peptide chain release factor N(5)-glutamine methyltransferase [Thermohalobaculum sp.]